MFATVFPIETSSMLDRISAIPLPSCSKQSRGLPVTFGFISDSAEQSFYCTNCSFIITWVMTKAFGGGGQSRGHVQALYNSMDCGTPGLPDPHHSPEFAQVHVRKTWLVLSYNKTLPVR